MFKALGEKELEKIIDIELESVQQRLETAIESEELLLREGTDSRRY